MIESIKDINDITDSMIVSKQFKDPIQFSTHIESVVAKSKLGYMDVIIDYCDRNNIDVTAVSCLVSNSLKEKIRKEAVERNFLKKKGELPV